MAIPPVLKTGESLTLTGSSPVPSAMIFRKNKNQPENLREVLDFLKKLQKENKELEKRIELLEKDNLFSIQRIGLVRYNPVKGVGGNQSFSLAFLSKENNGFVISSLYFKGESRIYAKPVSNGKSDHFLSPEEEQAISRAMRNI